MTAQEPAPKLKVFETQKAQKESLSITAPQNKGQEALNWSREFNPPIINNIIQEMNNRYEAYKTFSGIEKASAERIDQQVRADFSAFGSNEKYITFDPSKDANKPYSRVK